LRVSNQGCLITRIGQVLLAFVATGVSVLVLQWAMLA
jgi:hypothetical protein